MDEKIFEFEAYLPAFSPQQIDTVAFYSEFGYYVGFSTEHCGAFEHPKSGEFTIQKMHISSMLNGQFKG